MARRRFGIFSRQSRENGSLRPNTSKRLPSRLWEWRPRRQISYTRKNNSPTYAGYLVVFVLSPIKFLVPVSFAAHSLVTFYSPDFSTESLLAVYNFIWKVALCFSLRLPEKKKQTKQNQTKQKTTTTTLTTGTQDLIARSERADMKKCYPLNCISVWSWKCLMEGLLFYNLGVKSRA